MQLAGIGQQRAGGKIDERSLAGAVRAYDRGEPPGGQGYGNPVDRNEVTEALAGVLDSEKFRHAPGAEADGLAARPRHAKRRSLKMLITPSGRTITRITTIAPNQMSQYSVNLKIMSLITRKRSEPTIGPAKVWTPPMSVASTGSADVLQCAIGGVTVFSSGGSSAPARPA